MHAPEQQTLTLARQAGQKPKMISSKTHVRGVTVSSSGPAISGTLTTSFVPKSPFIASSTDQPADPTFRVSHLPRKTSYPASIQMAKPITFFRQPNIRAHPFPRKSPKTSIIAATRNTTAMTGGRLSKVVASKKRASQRKHLCIPAAPSRVKSAAYASQHTHPSVREVKATNCPGMKHSLCCPSTKTDPANEQIHWGPTKDIRWTN